MFKTSLKMAVRSLRRYKTRSFINMPLAYYFMTTWLDHYTYRTALTWWVFAAVAAGAITITFLTVSYACIRAALMNPTKSLRTE